MGFIEMVFVKILSMGIYIIKKALIKKAMIEQALMQEGLIGMVFTEEQGQNMTVEVMIKMDIMNKAVM